MSHPFMPMGVCVLPAPGPNAGRTVQNEDYIHEIFEHAGLCFSRVPLQELEGALGALKVLVTVGDADLSAPLNAALDRWLRAGGAWISVGGVCGMQAQLGVAPESPAYQCWGDDAATLGEGYLKPSVQHHVSDHVPLPLHFFNGIPVRAHGAEVLAHVLDAHGGKTDRVALCFKAVEIGMAMLIAPDLTGAVVRIQQGIAVTRDGIPAPDGTAAACDAVLKTSDGAVLDWLMDRTPVPNVAGYSAFLHPIADLWRELLLRCVFFAATHAGISLPLLWLYPRNLPALAHMSHDSDGNDSEQADILLNLLNQNAVQSTWCILPPSYPADVTGRILSGGHELAMHFDAMSHGCPFTRAAFHQQNSVLVSAFPSPPITNKNHYLRWEGDTEPFQWCLECGIQMDQSKGASKTGEAGFTFGTCHPYFPVSPDGRSIDVLELPTLTQDLEVFAPSALLPPLLEAVIKCHGVLHLLFHPYHTHKSEVSSALADSVHAARQQGLEWWTAEAINGWERARRAATWTSIQGENGVQIECGTALPDATILWLAHGTGEADTTRWGFPFHVEIRLLATGLNPLEAPASDSAEAGRAA